MWVVIIIICLLIVWLWYQNPTNIITWWNRQLTGECEAQNVCSLNGIPSYHNAWDSQNTTVVELHRLIHLYHDTILTEVLRLQNNYEETPTGWFKNDWHPIWVRFLGDWTSAADELPTLKKITALFPEIPELYISIFYPGQTLIDKTEPFRMFWRYHYGLKVPANDVGLKINGYNVKWEERAGFAWDPTLPHSAWNHTSEPRIIIFADVFRTLSSVNVMGSKLIYSLLQRSPAVVEIKHMLQSHNIPVT